MSIDDLKLHPRINEGFKKVKLESLDEILLILPGELEHRTRLSPGDIKCALNAAAAFKLRNKHLISVLSLSTSHGDIKDAVLKHLSTGCKIIDRLLRGGVINKGITQVCGESASGKTQFCIQLSLTVQLPCEYGGLDGCAVYVCTEDLFPSKRLMQMIKLLQQRCASNKTIYEWDFASRVFVEHVAELDDMCKLVNERLPVLFSKFNVKLIVIDSIAALFRSEFSSMESKQRAKKLNYLASALRNLGDKHGIPIVCINQVTGNFYKKSTNSDEQENIPALGIAWANWVTTSIMLRRTNKIITVPRKDLDTNDVQTSLDVVVRQMHVLFAPHLSKQHCTFIVDNEGVKGLE